MVDTQEEFYKWLDQCPVKHFETYMDHDSVTYCFLLPDTNMEELDDG